MFRVIEKFHLLKNYPIKFLLSLLKMSDPILYLSILLALGAIFTTISLFENDDDDDDGDGDKILCVPVLSF